MIRPLDGRCALITGSARGLGLAAAEKLAHAGCHIVLHDLANTADGAAIRARVEREHGVRACYRDADLRRPTEIEALFSAATAAFGPVDILINNAVVRHVAPVEAFDVAHWDEGLAVNLSAAFHTIRLAVPSMKRRGWGRIVNVASIYGLRGAVNRVGYVTSKTALIGLTRAVALETAGHGITCNVVCPGTSETPVHDATVDALAATDSITRVEAERRFLATKQPTGRFVPADDVAALIAFLCGPHGAHITGSVLPVDGGWSAG
jgi:3-hydroxybutyrate dehydrogenase